MPTAGRGAWIYTEEFRVVAARFRLVLERVGRATNSKRRARLESKLDELRATLKKLKERARGQANRQAAGASDSDRHAP